MDGNEGEAAAGRRTEGAIGYSVSRMSRSSSGSSDFDVG